MDEPARKRRKTSSPADRDRPSSPLKQPPRRPSFASPTKSGAERSSLNQPPRRFSLSPTKATFDRASSPLRQPPRRPSFASPTKASLSRNYPNLLPQRPTSSGSATSRPNSRGDLLARGKEARAFILGEKDTLSQARNENVEEDESGTAAGAPQLGASKSQNITPRVRRTVAYSGAIRLGDVVEEEAELPATPSQEATEAQDTPRRGILYSSPSKRPPRAKDPVKQSPLKPKAQARLAQESSEVAVDESIENVEAQDGPAKQKESFDPELEKKKQEKARLLRELETLEEQVTRCTEEIAKMQEQGPNHILQPEEREDLIAFINKISNASTKKEEEKAPAVSNLLCSFLPFSSRPILPPKPKDAHEKPIASHRPLDLDDPLPYLSMFTSFTFTTQLTLPRGRVLPSSNRVHQKHVIEITGPQKLLTAALSVIIDSLTTSIIDLKILRLSSWADRELGTFMRAKAQSQDLGTASWAIGSYWEIARKRAEYWHKCEAAFGHLIPGRTREDTENSTGRDAVEKSVTRKDLNRHLGKDVLVLQDRHVVLNVSWKIGFDWTGEAESEIEVRHAVPAVWTEADENNCFGKIPETFNALVQSKGVFAATKTMVALLFAG